MPIPAPVIPSPLTALETGQWFKLICGASFQHLPAVRSLALVYTLAGADCIDVAADPAVVRAARQGIAAAQALSSRPLTPWLMVSLNDGEDPHFRKASFDPNGCPPNCPRPCESVCPAQAIALPTGVLTERCYGCGRCLPVCPIGHILTYAQTHASTQMGALIAAGAVDALEIHTQVGRIQAFETLWQQLAPYAHHLRVLAISCPDGENLVQYLRTILENLAPLPCPLIWQTDGRPMSGDIGDGTTRATVKLGQKVLGAKLPGYVQLAGGTNRHTVAKLKAFGMLRSVWVEPQRAPLDCDASQAVAGHHPYVAGVAYGSYARKLLGDLLEELEAVSGAELEAVPRLLEAAVGRATALVSQLKSS
ncbi:4Fe-4S ferredoxin [Synechococcales cyanobacterium C]|uniref:4Fe-4S ferredoxin n=1 Tax=Petrachloros mirabilis ULC683 TaxID=2781853 RepID=A0A8K2A9J2_9CYAN|nr:LdpA C-terminal domain-containing domain [Petrachloros mirabilis]NCJ08090.1 4Fe-4S ferredoxin [Petrachloros mirabilis ULC683]